MPKKPTNTRTGPTPPPSLHVVQSSGGLVYRTDDVRSAYQWSCLVGEADDAMGRGVHMRTREAAVSDPIGWTGLTYEGMADANIYG
jgi:hypothetical protein